MTLPNELASQFAKVTNDSKKQTEETVYGTVISKGDKLYVNIDGSDSITPIVTTAEIKAGERVAVMIKGHTATVIGNITNPGASKETTDNIVGEFDVVVSKIGDFELVVADKVSTDQLEAKLAIVDELLADKATISELDAVKASIEDLDVKELEADVANIHKALIDKAEIKDLDAIHADIDILEADFADIETLVGGNLTMDNMQSLILTSSKVTVDNAFIKDAMIDRVSASKLTAGTINTSMIQIASDDGAMAINGSLQQFKDANGNVRIQIGKDANGDFTFVLYGEDGTGQLINQNGITSSAIGDGIIVNDMVADNAQISGDKLDISSVITEINDSSTNIKSSSIVFDDTGQSLSVAFNNLEDTVQNIKDVSEGDFTSLIDRMETLTTELDVQQGEIDTLVSNTTIVTQGGQTISMKDDYTSTKQTVNSISSKVSSLETTTSNISSKQVELEQTTDSITSRVSTVEAASKNTAELAARGIANGKMLYADPTFRNGNNGVNIYNKSQNGTLAITRINKLSDCPTTSSHCLEIKVTGNTSPGNGGFIQILNGRPNAVFIQRFIAKLPSGLTFALASNDMGDNFSDKWLTPNHGTGKWEEYIREVRCGSTGSFGIGGHVYVIGASPTADSPLVWHLASCTAYDVTDSDERISDLTTRVSTAESKITDSAIINTVSSTIDSKVNTGIDNIQIGGRNLIINSDVGISSADYMIKEYLLGNVKPVEKEIYTITIKGSLGSGRTHFGVYNSGGMILVGNLKSIGNGLHQYTGTWKITDGSITAANRSIYIYQFPQGNTNASTIEWVKLEKGNKATDWTPAPEDTIAKFDNYYTKTQTDSQIAVLNDSISSKVSKTEMTNTVNNIQVGNRNYLLNGNFSATIQGNTSSKHHNVYPRVWAAYNGGITSPGSSYHAHIDSDTFGYNVIEFNESDGTRNWKGIWQDITERFMPNTTYRVSMDIYTTGTGYSIFGGFYYYKNSNDTAAFHSGQFGANKLPKPLEVNKWQRISMDVPYPTDVNVNKPIAFYIYGYSFATNSIVYINNVCLTNGNQTVDWTPAPEEVTQQISDVETAINANLDKTLNQNTTELLTTVEGLYAKKDAFDSFQTSVSSQFTQTTKDIQMTFSEAVVATNTVNNNLETYKAEVQANIRFDANGIELGKNASPFKAKLNNTKLAFTENGSEIAYISNNKMHITEANIVDNMTIGKFIWDIGPNGNLTLKWSE